MTVTGEELVAATTFSWHQDARWGYQFLYPDGWRRLAFADGREGVLYAPRPDDWSTGFAVEATDLGIEVTGEDLPDLEAGFRQGLQSLPDGQVAWLLHWPTGRSLVLEAQCTFREGETTRQRRSRLVYCGRRQYHVFVQGATPEDFSRWRPLLYVMLMSFGVVPDQPPAASLAP
ncbi:MAG: hypothetical protein HYY04_18790 [Chloroflexi bacterium]|nr:hypothetical protein [Chloroflexota bacterium]